MADNRCLIVYFSRKGNNHVNGNVVNLSVGNTEVAAKMIQKLTKADIFEIKAVHAYPEDYNECVNAAQDELHKNSRPELVNYLDSIDKYDYIFVGYPNWWGTIPMPVFTFLERYNFSGKTILPFCTNEGGGMGRSESDIKKICPTANIKRGLALLGSNVKNSAKDIECWINEL